MTKGIEWLDSQRRETERRKAVKAAKDALKHAAKVLGKSPITAAKLLAQELKREEQGDKQQ